MTCGTSSRTAKELRKITTWKHRYAMGPFEQFTKLRELGMWLYLPAKKKYLAL
jgi:hypothetical protein